MYLYIYIYVHAETPTLLHHLRAIKPLEPMSGSSAAYVWQHPIFLVYVQHMSVICLAPACLES